MNGEYPSSAAVRVLRRATTDGSVAIRMVSQARDGSSEPQF